VPSGASLPGVKGVLDLSVDQIIAYTVLVVVGTACRIVHGHFMHKRKLEQMDKECSNRLTLERERKKRSHRQLDRPRPPPSR
jgi:hypothetical protein